MSEIITRSPTMANPDALHTVPELRAALHLANDEMLSMALDLHEAKSEARAAVDAIAHNVNMLIRMFKLHESGDVAALNKMLDSNLAAYRSMMDEIEEGRKATVQ